MKQNKVLGVIALCLSLAVVACGGTKECKSHKWSKWQVVTAETCTKDGVQERVCSVCNKKETKAIPAAHKWGEWNELTPSTCAVHGQEQRLCSRCDAHEERDLDLLEHTYQKDADGKDVVNWTKPATCLEGGTGTRHCTVCLQDIPYEAEALGHIYEKDTDGNDVVVWSKPATCEEGGVGQKECTRCHEKEDVTADPLGHEWTTVGGTKTPAQAEGYADFWEFPCAHAGCTKTSLGFKANEPTLASREHLVFEENNRTHEIGARFWGRPIGNALKLSANGTSVNQTNYECVYSSTEKGDFFEYKFSLSAEQAATLSTCLCYCDAKAADYLNGADFWACSETADEWTPGYYIDGADDHIEKGDDGQPVMVNDHAPAPKTVEGVKWTQAEIDAAVEGDPAYGKTTDDYKVEPVEATEGQELETKVPMGKRISNYRYILYVDDEVKAFDPSMTAPTHGSNSNMQREEFVMPYVFHLKEGVNTISLRMAGGYRSLFYNFYFRQYVAPTPSAGA